ncbi:MAG: hypothetical protein AAF902_21400 [Chloroflexota bacterium]
MLARSLVSHFMLQNQNIKNYVEKFKPNFFIDDETHLVIFQFPEVLSNESVEAWGDWMINGPVFPWFMAGNIARGVVFDYTSTSKIEAGALSNMVKVNLKVREKGEINQVAFGKIPNTHIVKVTRIESSIRLWLMGVQVKGRYISRNYQEALEQINQFNFETNRTFDIPDELMTHWPA